MVADTQLYDILGVSPDVNERDLKKAFMKKAREVHPDKNQDDPDATAKFQQVNEAYEILKDPTKRERYDKYGAEGLREGGGGSGFDDILSHLFGFQTSSERSKPRTRDIVHRTTVTLEDEYNGEGKTIKIDRHVPCPKCNGKGTKDGKDVKKCKKCGGQGRVILTQHEGNSIYQTVSACPKCKGEGEVVDEKNKCANCKGEKLIIEKKEVQLRIERGTEEGDHIVFQGAGDEIPGAETGDIVVVIEEEPHERFERHHNDLLFKKTLSLSDALYGAKFVIEHLDGRQLVVETNPNEVIKPGTCQVIENEGMPIKGDSFKKGKLYIEYEIVFPEHKKLTNEFKKALFKVAPPSNELKGVDMNAETVHKVTTEEADAEDFYNAKKTREEGRREAYRSSGDSDYEIDDDDEGGEQAQCQPM